MFNVQPLRASVPPFLTRIFFTQKKNINEPKKDFSHHHSPGNPQWNPFQSLLVKVAAGCVPVRCVETTFDFLMIILTMLSNDHSHNVVIGILTKDYYFKDFFHTKKKSTNQTGFSHFSHNHGFSWKMGVYMCVSSPI